MRATMAARCTGLDLELALAGILLAMACSGDSSEPSASGAPPPLAEPIAASIYERAGQPFDAVQLLRPDNAADLPFDVYLAPMVVQERTAQTPENTAAFGALALGGDGRAVVRPERPVVYFARSHALLGGERREQLAFLWWYPDAHPSALRAQGVRMTLGKSGVPILWEVLADASGARLVFVSETLEELARAQHGAPLAGRRFSVERSLTEAPGIVVARAISNGGVALGPYVYLDAATRSARTLLCRCSPAEFGALDGELLFELAPLESLAAIGLDKRDWTPDLPSLADSPPPPAPDDADPSWLERNLRLPQGL
jgi:hypothetical protein